MRPSQLWRRRYRLPPLKVPAVFPTRKSATSSSAWLNTSFNRSRTADYPAVTNLAEAVAARPPTGVAWNYPQGVMLYGLECYSDATGGQEADRFVVEHNLICARYYHWLAGLQSQFGGDGRQFVRRTPMKLLMELGSLDSCGAMGNEMLVSLMHHPDRVTTEEEAVVARIADWVVQKQGRLPDGTLWRPETMGGTVWPDDLYMGGVFLVRYGIYTHNQAYIDDAASNIIHQAAFEQDRDGLWFHGYFVKEKRHAPFKWGRGNGWAMVAMVEDLSAMPENDPLRPEVLAILRKQIESLKTVQAPTGMWRQVLDEPQTWEETSCTAMFAYGIARAVNRGWIDTYKYGRRPAGLCWHRQKCHAGRRSRWHLPGHRHRHDPGLLPGPPAASR